MSGDGFAVKTTISQLGNVARTQLKSQQPVAHTDGRKPGENESRVEQVRQTEESQKNKLDPDGHQEREQARREAGDEGEREGQDEGRRTDRPDDTDVGRVIDTKA